MANLGNVLREEVTRLARKATKSEIQSLRRAVSESRRQIAALKRELATVQGNLRSSARRAGAPASGAEGGNVGPQLRFSAKGLAKKRQQLGISAASMAKLLGVSALSVYKWESGQTRPRAKQVSAIASVRAMGKRAALQKLAEHEG